MPDGHPAGMIAGGAPVTEPAQPTLSRGAIVRRALVLVGLLVLVFGVVLPRLVDYDAVRAALAALSPGQLALLGAASAVAYIARAGPYHVLVSKLSWPHAVGSDLAARAIVSTVPGPTDVATRFVLYRQMVDPDLRSRAPASPWRRCRRCSPYAALPMIAAAGVIIAGHPTWSHVLLLAFVGPHRAGRSRGSAGLVRTVGDPSLGSWAGWLDRMTRRPEACSGRRRQSGIVEGMLDLRERSKTMLTDARPDWGSPRPWSRKLAWFVVLEVALWCVGVGPDVLPPSDVLAAMAVVWIVTLVPITPGAVGVTEIAYIGVLSSVAGSGMTEQLTAAVMLYRIAQWLFASRSGGCFSLSCGGATGGICSGAATWFRQSPRAEGSARRTGISRDRGNGLRGPTLLPLR